MKTKEEKTEFWQKYRPTKLDDVIGQDSAVRTIRGFGSKIPHCLLFTGSSGVGKTTMARIISRMLGCPPENTFDYKEINCAGVVSAVETMREIGFGSTAGPIAADCRVWVLDECQALGRFKYAQECLLKVFEDSLDHARFMICTTDATRILKTVRNRCSHIALTDLSARDVDTLLKRVAKAERLDVAQEVYDKIGETVNGSARQALVVLEAVAGLPPEERMKAIGRPTTEKVAFDLAKLLLPWEGGVPPWSKVAAMLTELKEMDPEGIRLVVLATARTALLKGGKNSHPAHKLIFCLDRPLYEDKTAGNAILAAGLFKFCQEK